MEIKKGKKFTVSLLIVLVFLVAVASGVFIFQRFSASGTQGTRSIRLTVTDKASSSNQVTSTTTTKDVDKKTLNVIIPGSVSYSWVVEGLNTTDHVCYREINGTDKTEVTFATQIDKTHPAPQEINITTDKTIKVSCYNRKLISSIKIPDLPIGKVTEILDAQVVVKPSLKLVLRAYTPGQQQVESIYNLVENKTGSAVDLKVEQGHTIDAAWESTTAANVKYCIKSGGWMNSTVIDPKNPKSTSGKAAASGRESTIPITASTTLKISCVTYANAESNATVNIIYGATPTGTLPPAPTSVDTTSN